MDILEVRVLVQGFRESPDVVAQLIDSTVRNLTSAFAMKPAELEVRKATLRQELKKPPANLGDFAGRFWSQIWDETYCFDKVDKELKVLEGVTPQSLAEAWNRTTGSSKKLLVKLFGSDPTGDVKIPEVQGKEVITDLAGLNLDAAISRFADIQGLGGPKVLFRPRRAGRTSTSASDVVFFVFFQEAEEVMKATRPCELWHSRAEAGEASGFGSRERGAADAELPAGGGGAALLAAASMERTSMR
ncbi:unnamed protein product [Effrenium voratum]|nr:unnamed protein product [Effrenium voratum]